jgi:hypothetical protein
LDGLIHDPTPRAEIVRVLADLAAAIVPAAEADGV